MQNFGTKAWTSQQRAYVLLTANLTCTCDYANPLLKQPQGQSCPRDVVHIALPRSDPPCSTNLVTICLFKLLPLFLSYTSQSSQRTASVFPICAPTNSQPLCLALQCLPIPAAHSPNAQTFLLLHPQYYLQARSSEIPPARGVATPLLTRSHYCPFLSCLIVCYTFVLSPTRPLVGKYFICSQNYLLYLPAAYGRI